MAQTNPIVPANEIDVIAGTYGGNVGAKHGNVTLPLGAACNNRPSCTYAVNMRQIGDPVPGKTKDFVAEWKCGPSGPTQTVKAAPEANGHAVTLACAPAPVSKAPMAKETSNAIAVVAGSYGSNMGGPHGNATAQLAAACNGTFSCTFQLELLRHQIHLPKDPFSMLPGDFTAEWHCGPSSQTQTAHSPPAPSGGSVTLTCNVDPKAPAGGAPGASRVSNIHVQRSPKDLVATGNMKHSLTSTAKTASSTSNSSTAPGNGTMTAGATPDVPLLQNIKIVSVYWGSAIAQDFRTKMESFYKGFATSQFFQWLNEYDIGNRHIGAGSFVKGVQISPTVTNNPIDDDQIKSELGRNIDNGTLPAPETVNSIYVVHLPSGVDVFNGAKEYACSIAPPKYGADPKGTSFCAYHGMTTSPKGARFAYAVVPDLSASNCSCYNSLSNTFTDASSWGTGAGQTIDWTTRAVSHEMVEAITDADTSTGWREASTGGNEVGDICNGIAGTISTKEGYFAVQKEWSASKSTCLICDLSRPRGAGTIPTTCAPDEENNAGLCYKKCPSGYTGAAFLCYQSCPSGFTESGVGCFKPAAYGRGGGYPWKFGDALNNDGMLGRCQNDNPQGCEMNGAIAYPKCKSGFHAFGSNICTPDCPSGWHDDGASCLKPTSKRAVGTVPDTCGANKEYSAGLCYTKCDAGFTGVGPVCWASACSDEIRENRSH